MLKKDKEAVIIHKINPCSKGRMPAAFKCEIDKLVPIKNRAKTINFLAICSVLKPIGSKYGKIFSIFRQTK